MKNITLLRHAKSEWHCPGVDDHDRPLNKRGFNAAPQMGSYLEKRGLKPDLLLSSTALRARTTAELIADKLQVKREKIQLVKELYLASIPDYEEVIRSIDDTAGNEHVMIFSHNPGTHELARYLTGGNEIERFTTCAVAIIELNINHWGEIGPDCGKLTHFATPRDIPSA